MYPALVLAHLLWYSVPGWCQGVHHTHWRCASGVPCSSLDLFVFVWMLGSCRRWCVGCVSGTGVGLFVVVLSAGVGGVSVFIVVFVLVWRVHVDQFTQVSCTQARK